MKQPLNRDQEERSLSNQTRVTIVVVLIAVGLLLLITLVVFAIAGKLPLTPAQDASAIPPTSIAPTLFIPTADCGAPTLVVGTTTLQMQTIQLAPDGSVNVPPDGNGTAYWIEGTDLQFTFILSPTAENLALASTITEGTVAKATWPNCNSMTFSLSAPQPGTFGVTYLPEQSTASIMIFFQSDSSGNGFIVGGGLTEEQISTFNTPVSNGTDVQAEIGLLETITFADGATITLNVSIYNYGTSAITVSANDVSLTPAGAAPLEMMDSNPRLPEKIGQAETETFTFTFPRPSTFPATLKVFTVEYDIE